MNKFYTYLLVLAFTGSLVSCKKAIESPQAEAAKSVIENPLPSFNDGATKSAIIDFVKKVTDSTGDGYVKPEDRIACFDNDGTLWLEQPLPSQIYFDFDRIKALAPEHPEWKTKMPFKAVLEDDAEAMKKFGMADILAIVGTAQESSNVNNFDAVVKDWLKTAKHPVFKKSYTSLVYQPMLELLDYLRANQFIIYIVSGGSQEFMRAWAPRVYGVPKENIIGSTFKTETVTEGTDITIKQTPNFDFYDDHEGKAISINKFIGKKPIFIAGNSDGDLEMMEYADTNNPLNHFLLYVKHTDGEREVLYDKNVHLGALIKGEVVAKEKGWTIIDMKKDWKTVFPTEAK